MNIVSLHEVSHAYGARVVLDRVSLGLEAGAKVGLVGINGSGKSTLFRILVGEEAADSGTVARHRELTVAYLPQEPRLDPTRTARATVELGLAALLAARAEARAVARALEQGESERTEALLARYEALTREVDRLGGYETGHLVERMMMHLGVHSFADRAVGELSGGQRKRVALARVLLARPGLYVLDEPTNHLDADTVDWLEGELSQTKAAVALITHDRYFLDRVVSRMWELYRGEVVSYAGNYTAYVVQKHERLLLQQRADARRVKLLEQEIAWLNRAPSARTGKQKARQNRIDDLLAPVPGAREDVLSLQFTPQAKLKGDTVLNAVGVTGGFPGAPPLFRDVTLRMVRGDRVGIIGPNGCGKTTLLRSLLAQVPLLAGSVETGPSTRIGYFDQERAGIDPAATLRDAIAPNADHVRVGTERIHIRSFLHEFLFPTSEHARTVGTLSGGERTRLLLARLVAEGANLIVLDEPTNDLDIDTLQVLEDALSRFEGCLLVVTHDRYLLNRVVTHILAFDEPGVVRLYAGDYDLYKKTREAERSAERRETPRPDKPAATRPRPARSAFGTREAALLQAVEADIATAEAERHKYETLLANSNVFAGDPSRLQTLAERHAAVAARLEELYERWAELMERRETAAAD